MVTKTRSHDGESKGKGIEAEVPMEQWMSRMEEMMEDLQKSTLEAQNSTARQFAEIMAVLNRSRGDQRKKENPEDQICNDEELAEIEAETKSSGIEDRAVENEANSDAISAIEKEESIPQFLMVTEADSTCAQHTNVILQQVSTYPLEHSLNFCKANLDVKGNCECAMGKTHQIWSDYNSGCVNDDTCQVFDVIPMRTKVLPKEHKERFPKSWMFKFKTDSKSAGANHILLQEKKPSKTPKSWKLKFKISFEDTDFVVKMDQWCILGQLWLDHRNQTGCVPIEEALFMETDADYAQQDEFEQVVNHTPFSVVKFGKYKACDALLLLLPSDERFQVKHKWRFRLSHSLSEMKQRMIGRVWKSFGYLMEDMMEEDQKLQGDSEPLLTALDFAAKICETFDQYIRKRGLVSADQETEDNQLILRSFMKVIQYCLNQYRVLLLASVAYDVQFSVGVGMNKKQLRLSLRNNRVWDPGGSLVDAATPCLLSLHFTALHFIAAILSSLQLSEDQKLHHVYFLFTLQLFTSLQLYCLS